MTPPPLQRGRNLKKLGMKAQDTSELFFEDVRLPRSALLGEENKGFAYLMRELPQERLLIADMGVASAEACYEYAVHAGPEQAARATPQRALTRARLSPASCC